MVQFFDPAFRARKMASGTMPEGGWVLWMMSAKPKTRVRVHFPDQKDQRVSGTISDALGADPTARAVAYRALFQDALPTELVAENYG